MCDQQGPPIGPQPEERRRAGEFLGDDDPGEVVDFLRVIDHGRIDVEFGQPRTQALLPRAASFFGQHSVFLFGTAASIPPLRVLAARLSFY